MTLAVGTFIQGRAIGRNLRKREVSDKEYERERKFTCYLSSWMVKMREFIVNIPALMHTDKQTGSNECTYSAIP